VPVTVTRAPFFPQFNEGRMRSLELEIEEAVERADASFAPRMKTAAKRLADRADELLRSKKRKGSAVASNGAGGFGRPFRLDSRWRWV
jgi:hypothetical protein